MSNNILDDLLGNKPDPTPESTAPKIQIPKRPSAPTGKAAGYAVVENVNPDGSEIVTAFLNTVLNTQLCSDADREMAARALMNITGRKLNVSVVDILKYVSSSMGVSIPALTIVKAMFPVRGNMYLNITPSLVIVTSFCTLGLTLAFRRQPDITIVILCVLMGFMLSIGLVNWA